MLSVRGLSKAFDARHGTQRRVTALDDVDLDVADGAFAAVLGASGSGKTTLLRCLAGFEVPDTGTITLSGRELVSPTTPSVRPNRRGIGIVPQQSALFPHLSTAENIAFGLPRRPRTERRDRVETLLRLVGMEGLGARRPHELSGGQQQRVALARALAPEPALILLDEPFSALDAKLRVDLRAEVQAVLRSLGTTAVLVTHDQSEAMTMADHLVVLRAGHVVAAGAPRDVYDEPADLQLATFLGAASVLPGELQADGTQVVCALGTLPTRRHDEPSGPCVVMTRPEDLELDASPTAHTNGGAEAVISHTSYFGHDALAYVTLHATGHELAVRVPGHARHDADDHVFVRSVQPVCTYRRDGDPT